MYGSTLGSWPTSQLVNNLPNIVTTIIEPIDSQFSNGVYLKKERERVVEHILL